MVLGGAGQRGGGGCGVGGCNGGGRQRFDAREHEFRAQVERRETEFAAEREELLRRIRELEALRSGSDGDKAELTLLRSKVKQLQDLLETEVRSSQEHQKNTQAAEAEARVVRGDLKTVKEKLEKVERTEKENKSEVEVGLCVGCAACGVPFLHSTLRPACKQDSHALALTALLHAWAHHLPGRLCHGLLPCLPCLAARPHTMVLGALEASGCCCPRDRVVVCVCVCVCACA